MATADSKRNGSSNMPKSWRHNNAFLKKMMLMAGLALLACLGIGSTLAWISSKTDPAVNTFTAGKVEGEVEEEFDGTQKTNVTVVNKGNVDAFVRVKLVSYRVDDGGKPVGGTAEIKEFSPGKGWVEYKGFYYYTQPVKAGESPAEALIGEYTLEEYEDGSRQVLEVMAELIQSKPAKAVGEAWGVTISDGEVTDYDGNQEGG